MSSMTGNDKKINLTPLIQLSPQTLFSGHCIMITTTLLVGLPKDMPAISLGGQKYQNLSDPENTTIMILYGDQENL